MNNPHIQIQLSPLNPLLEPSKSAIQSRFITSDGKVPVPVPEPGGSGTGSGSGTVEPVKFRNRFGTGTAEPVKVWNRFGTGTVEPAKVRNRFGTGSSTGSKDTPLMMGKIREMSKRWE